MTALARERRRFGYRRLHVLLRREGYRVNHKKLFRLYREERLVVRRRGARKRAIGTRAPMLVPLAPGRRWSLDFVSDQLEDGRRFRILTIVDDCTRENLALVADTSLSGVRVARKLDRLVAEYGRPKMIVSDNGSEFTSNAILAWPDRSRVEWHDIAPGSPCRTASSRASTAACATNLSTRRCSRLNPPAMLAFRRAGYNTARPHSQLRWSTPAEFAATIKPRRALALRSLNGSAPPPVAHPAREATPPAGNDLSAE